MTPVSRGVNEAVLNCRDCDAPTNVHPECWPIPIPSNDPFFPRVNTQTGRPICLPFTRSLPGQQNLGARQQVNQNTAFIDASHIYGQTVCDSNKLRAFSGGRLNSTLSPFGGQTLLPQSNLKPECQASSRLCFEAGDSRVTENPGLSVLHTSMLREHNRIATELQALNRNWDDERLFQTSRRIVNAIWQHVSFNEYLPRVLGWVTWLDYYNSINQFHSQDARGAFTSDSCSTDGTQSTCTVWTCWPKAISKVTTPTVMLASSTSSRRQHIGSGTVWCDPSSRAWTHPSPRSSPSSCDSPSSTRRCSWSSRPSMRSCGACSFRPWKASISS